MFGIGAEIPGEEPYIVHVEDPLSSPAEWLIDVNPDAIVDLFGYSETTSHETYYMFCCHRLHLQSEY